ncbi:MAG: ABC transporter substrate-binding protein [Pseudomonadota bacterium]
MFNTILPHRLTAAALAALVALAAPIAPDANAQTREMVMAAPRDLAPGAEDAYYVSSILYVWEPLVQFGPDGGPVPQLLSGWEMSEDATRWTFTLRDGVTWHNGDALTAEHVVGTFERIIQVSPKRSPFYSMHIDRAYPGLVAIEAQDALTFTMEFDSPRPTLPHQMVNFSSAVFHPDNFDADGNFNDLVIGTGPFRLVSHTPDQELVLERFEEYWGTPAGTERVVVRTIPDADTRAAALRAEEIVGVMDLGAMPPEQAASLAEDDRFELNAHPSSISHFLHVSGGDGPLSDMRLRQAISMAIDREAIVQLYRGFTTPTANFLNVNNPFHIDVPLVHDPEAAADLAAEVLGAERMDIRLIIPSWGVARYPYRAQAELIQFMLQPIGLDVTIQLLDRAAFNEVRQSGDYDLSLSTLGLPNADPITVFRDYFTRDGAMSVRNAIGYENPDMTALLEAALAERDLDLRAGIYADIQRLAATELPTIPLMNDTTVIVHHVDVVGYRQTIYGGTLNTAAWAD